MTAPAISQQPPAVGQPAPDFALQSTSGATVTLAEFRGRKNVLLAFFPLAFTSTCTAELCEMRDDYSIYERGDVVVLPISVDSVPTLKEFRKMHSMRTELLSDFKREATNAYGVMWQDAFFSNRAYFLIDREGIVRWAHVEANPGQKRTTPEIMAQIDALS
jgi:peroxiredoxin